MCRHTLKAELPIAPFLPDEFVRLHSTKHEEDQANMDCELNGNAAGLKLVGNDGQVRSRKCSHRINRTSNRIRHAHEVYSFFLGSRV
jgi:hypothetical protein